MFNVDNSNIEIQAIQKAIKENKSLRLHKRFKVILRHLEGYLNYEIAEMELLCANTVGTYINKYNEYGLDGLILRHSTGVPRLLSDE